MQEVINYKDTRVENFHTIYPNHMNRHDTLFGGQTLYWLDDVQGLVIRRYTHLPFFTASIDTYQFLDVVHRHEALIIDSYISRVGIRSVEIFAELSAFNHETRQTRLVGICFSTFALNKETVLENPLPKVEYTDEISKFVSGTYTDRQSGKLTARAFCKEYLKYYNK